MVSNLLEVISFDNTIKQTKNGAVSPLLMEFPVNPDLTPFLVSSTRSVQWVFTTSQTGTIRSAVRKRKGIEADILNAIYRMGTEAQWGNIHPLTTKGISHCIEHVSSYDLEPLELVVPQDLDLSDVELPNNLLVTRSSWVPDNFGVVVPIDRSFVGTLGTIGKHKAVALVHNASRGVAIAWK